MLIFGLPLDFHGKLRVIRSMFTPGAPHGIEASYLAVPRKVAWSCGYLGFGFGQHTSCGFCSVPAAVFAAEDEGAWSYSVCLMVKWAAFSGTLHWPSSGADLGVGGVSHVELLLLYELWAGERLVLEKSLPGCRTLGRPNSVSAVPFRPGIDFLRSCRFVGALTRFTVWSVWWIGRFAPCMIYWC